MKKMKNQLFVFVIFSVFIFMQSGCEPDDNTEVATGQMVIDTLTENYVFNTRIDKVVYASLWGSSLTDYKIDLNNDLVDDIEFSCSVYHHMVYDEWNAEVKTLNDSVSVDIEQDTVFIATYSIAYFNPSDTDSIRITYNENYSFSKQYPSNLIITWHIEEYPVIHSVGDSLNTLCNWKSGRFVLEYDDHHQGEIQNKIQTGIWRGIVNKFIGVRFVEKSVPYYGWIELSADDYRITLHKYALKLK